MRPRIIRHEPEVFSAFKRFKVLTIPQICSLLQCSIATVKRRLQEWKVLSSYNRSGRFHTLPSIPQFNKKGLWKHQGAFFSKHGTVKNTVIHLVRVSRKGLSNAELTQILGINVNSYLPQYKQLPGIKREKHRRQVVYFSADEEAYRRQRDSRYPREPTTAKLPPDALSVVIFVELIKHPQRTPTELSAILRRQGYTVDARTIEDLLAHHGLVKKKRNTPE